MVLINPGITNNPDRLQLATRQGTPIPNTRKLPRNPLSMQAAEKIWHEAYPGIETRSLSSSYNCGGMVFAFRRTTIEPEEYEWILSEDGYRRVADMSKLCAGDIIVYKSKPNGEIKHIGLIVEIIPHPATATFEVKVLSQWGLDGEYMHREDNVPTSYGAYREYYTERIE